MTQTRRSSVFASILTHSGLHLQCFMVPLSMTRGIPHSRVCFSVGESESEVLKSCPTLCDPMDYSLLGSSIHGIFQARVLEWVAISFSRGSS